MSDSFGSLCLFLALLAGSRSECTLPAKDSILMKAGTECVKGTGKDVLCFGKCLLETMEVVKDGRVNKTRLEEIIDNMEEGGSKEAAKAANRKCIKDGQKIDLKQSHCMGYLRMAKCVADVFKKKCPALMNLKDI